MLLEIPILFKTTLEDYSQIGAEFEENLLYKCSLQKWVKKNTMITIHIMALKKIQKQ